MLAYLLDSTFPTISTLLASRVHFHCNLCNLVDLRMADDSNEIVESYVDELRAVKKQRTETEDGETIWDVGVMDGHCHPTDIMASLDAVGRMKARAITIMASRSQDQDLVSWSAIRWPISSKEELLDAPERYVIPSFGWHPWFSYQLFNDLDGAEITSESRKHHLHRVLTPSPGPEHDSFLDELPRLISLKQMLKETEDKLDRHSLALVGEIGLDRPFRIPYGAFRPPKDPYANAEDAAIEDVTPGSREGRALSPFRVQIDHQKLVLREQFKLAGKHDRAVSVHSVQAHGVIFEVLSELWKDHMLPSKRSQKRRKSNANAHDIKTAAKATEDKPKPFPPRICLHSYSGPPEPLKQFLDPKIPSDVYFSFSMLVNFSADAKTPHKAVEVIRMVPEDRILIESDYHCAGRKMDELLGQIVRRVCEIRGWRLAEGARRLRANWEAFVFG